MSRLDNLKPFNTMPPEEHRALSVRGGIASGAARRRKRAAIEQEKIRNAALREQRHENVEILRAAAKLLLRASR